MSGGGKDRVLVYPSRGNYATMKVRLKSAIQGHQLLETKVDALEVRFRKSLKVLMTTRTQMGLLARDCFFALAESKFHVSPCPLGETVLTGAGEQGAQLTTRTTTENVAGVLLPLFVIHDSQRDAYATLGLARGGTKVRQVKEAFRNLLEKLAHLATLEASFRQLDDVIKITKRRVHALENGRCTLGGGLFYVVLKKDDASNLETIFRQLDEIIKTTKGRVHALENGRCTLGGGLFDVVLKKDKTSSSSFKAREHIFRELDEVIKSTKRRVHALENGRCTLG